MKNACVVIAIGRRTLCRAAPLLVSALGLLILLSCGGRGHAPRPGTVVVGLSGDFDSLNELNAADADAVQAIQYLLFLSLTTLDANLQFAPQLAESWEFDAGDTLLTFRLRRDIFWSDGVPTTAHDVRFTYELAVDSTVAYPAHSRFELTTAVSVPDDYTVRFHFKRPYADALFDTQMPILPRHLLAHLPREQLATCEFNRRPIGNGPFRLLEWRANQHLIFVANEKFAPGRPALDRLIFQIIPDETALVTALLTGQIDVAPGLSPAAFQQLAGQAQRRTGQPQRVKLQMIRYPGRSYTFIAWNNARPLFSRPLRQALTHAINKQEIITTLLAGHARPAVGPLPPYAWAYDHDLHDLPFDPQLARNLLRQEGWHDSDGDSVLERQGQKLEFTLITNADNPLRRDVAVMVQAQLRKIGVRVKVEAVGWPRLLQQVMAQRDFDALLAAWEADFAVNPAPLWHSQAITLGYNLISYRNARVDSLLQQARALPDRRHAMPLWREFQRLILEDCPYTFLFIEERLAAAHSRVHNLNMDVRGWLANVRQWRVE
ncbi:MAG: peptide-binding protein [candidate division KSB1 bacterium]|nr:peptide-binding protein [candidate division KSB1 bacterium]MDZ7274526.1 peptide-binding protein [candidate division KSB1 bacterium]MDZ7284813.1 peptide-binding protein [candidate division KSB1 bacterium]MDZ7297767.1 peptide-binding protein [candidate division KSB1 bacterium]MDZ7306444.1 peptide-binding protein [candidate division KSB1 bacterium]